VEDGRQDNGVEEEYGAMDEKVWKVDVFGISKCPVYLLHALLIDCRGDSSITSNWKR
jgi:hypothetical protein